MNDKPSTAVAAITPLPRPTAVAENFERFSKRHAGAAKTWKDAAEKLDVTDLAAFQRAAHNLVQIRRLRSMVESSRVDAVDRFARFVAALSSMIAPVTDELEAAEEIIKAKVATWACVFPKEDFPHAAGVQLREVWKGAVQAVGSIPDEYKVPDLSALQALTKAKGKDLNIPGWQVARSIQVAILEKS